MPIRQEAPGDDAAISAVTEAAFKDAPHSDQTEAAIIVALRAANALTISLVATNANDVVVGHVAFSPITIDGEYQGWYGLGPVSVMPTCQGRGIGSDLINDGIAQLRTLGARGCVVLGDPAYYGRFGFRSDNTLTYRDVPSEYLQALALTDRTPAGAVAYHAGFDAK
jgi:putative acetyltransferase